jgi:dienelactone hydrolase
MVRDGDTLYVLQSLGTCTSATARVVRVRCVAPPFAPDPAGLNLFPVGQESYDGGTVSILGTTYDVRGTVFYPAEDDGPGQPFHARLAALGKVPIVFMAHGNHATFRDPANPDQEACGNPGGWVEIPNHEGYDYFQRALARMGIIAVSVYSNQTNCKAYGATNMRERAELIIASIAHFQVLAGNPGSVFHDKIDFGRIGLMGHSRGGEAVVVAPEIIGLPGATISAVLSLAPTNAGASSGAPKVPAFMTILPAGDGDVVDNNGAVYYDRATPSRFKCQLYVHYTNHNFFNRQWPGDESKGPPVLVRSAHERILLAYGCALFRAALLGHATTRYLSGHVRPAGTASAEVHLSFEQKEATTVDHHENAGGIGTNTVGAPT